MKFTIMKSLRRLLGFSASSSKRNSFEGSDWSAALAEFSSPAPSTSTKDQLDDLCITCKYYSNGHAECRRFPPVPVVTNEKRYNVYNHLDEYPVLLWMYPSLDPSHQKCGEYVYNRILDKEE